MYKPFLKLNTSLLDRFVKKTLYENIYEFFCKTPKIFWTAIISTYVIGIATHLFVFTNGIFLGDGMWYYLPIDSGTLLSTRWLGGIIMFFTRSLNLPWAIGIIELFFVGCAVFFLYKIFGFEHLTSQIIVSAVIVSFPSFTVVQAYIQSGACYAIALFFSVLAAWFLCCYKKNVLIGALWASVLSVLVSSIYQAYICCTMILIILFVFKCIAFDNKSPKENWSLALRSLCAIGLSVVAYYLLIYTLSSFSQFPLDYRAVGFRDLPFRTFTENLISVKITIDDILNFYFVKDPYKIYNGTISNGFYIVTIICVVTCVLQGIKTEQMKKTGNLLLLVMAIVAFPFAINLFAFLPLGSVHQMPHLLMKYSFCMPIVFSILVLEKISNLNEFKSIFFRLVNKIAASMLLIFMLLLIHNQWITANAAYSKMNKVFNESIMTSNRIVSQIQNIQGYTTNTPVHYIGYFSNNNYVGTSNIIENGFARMRRMVNIGNNLSYANMLEYFIFFNEQHLGVRFNSISLEQQLLLDKDKQVEEMPVYPNQGYIQMFDGVIVVKLSDNTKL